MRSSVNDYSNQPVKNLITNPSAETAGSQVVVWRNLLTNPSGETVASGTSVYRTNLVVNPSAEVDANGFGTGNPGSGSPAGVSNASRVAGAGMAGGAGYVKTWTTAPQSYTGSTIDFAGIGGLESSRIPVTPGSSYIGSVWFKSSWAVTAVIKLVWHTAGSNTGPMVSAGGNVSVVANTWTRLYMAAPAPATAATLRLSIEQTGGTPATVGDAWTVDQALVEQGDQLRPYFDGSTSSSLGWAYSWTSTANASSSVAKATLTSVRTNYATNPRGVNAWGLYNTGGTVTAGVTVTDHPLGIGTANRMTYAANDAFPGFSFATVPTGTYHVSAWVYHESGTAGSAQGFGVNNVSSVNTAASVIGSWVRLDASLTVSGTGNVGFRMNVPSNSGSFLVTGALVERTAATTVDSYFDGFTSASADYIYNWTGTAHASTSVQQAPAVLGDTPSTAASNSMSYDWSSIGTVSRRVKSVNSFDTFFAPGGDQGGLRNGMIAGGTYTAIGTIRLTAPQTTGFTTGRARRIVVFWNTGSYIETPSTVAPNAAGITELRITFTIPANATEAFVRFYNGALPGDADVWWDKLAIVEGAYNGPYFDGNNTLSDPDLTTVWTGTTDASTTEVRALSVATFSPNPGVRAIQSVQWSAAGGKSLRIITTQSNTNLYVDWNVPASQWLPGNTYTFLAKRRTIADLSGATAGALSVRFWGSSTVDTTIGPSLTTGLQTPRLTFTVPSDTTALSMRLYSGGTSAQPDVWWDDMMLVEGSYSGPYGDGTSYDWSWTGTAHASISKGYPVPSTLVRNVSIYPAFLTDNNSGVNSSGGVTQLGGPQGSYTYSYDSSDRIGGMGRSRVDTYTTTGAFGRRWAHADPVAAGQTIRSAYWIKLSSAQTIQPYFEWSTAIGGYTGGGAAGSPVAIPANLWTRVTANVTVPTGPTAQLRTTGFTAISTDANLVMKLGPNIVTIDQPLPDFHGDGDTPGWRWLGAAGQSASIGGGYSSPIVPLSTVSGSSAQGTYSVSSAKADRTAYFVYDVLSPPVAGATIVRLGSANINQTRIRVYTSADRALAVFNVIVGLGSGTTEQTLGNIVMQSGSLAVGRHIAIMRMTNSATTFSLSIDNGPTQTMTASANDGIVIQSYWLYSAAEYQGEFAGIIDRGISDAEQVVLFKWLANKYGGVIG